MRVSSSLQQMPFEAEELARALAERIRTARKARRLTQADLASKAGISTNTLLAIEKGAVSVQLGYWLQVLWALDLLGGLADRVAELGQQEGEVALLESMLPQRVRSSR